jgi:hypothetical protein
MILVEAKTGKVVNRGDMITTFDGESVLLVDWLEPRCFNSTGRIVVRSNGVDDLYYPSVCNLEWEE